MARGVDGIDIVVIANNNSAFSQEKASIDMLGHGNAFGNPEGIYAFWKVNFSRIAEEMGCLGMRVDKPHEIKPALAKAFVANRPVVVAVISDIDAMPEWSHPAVWWRRQANSPLFCHF